MICLITSGCSGRVPAARAAESYMVGRLAANESPICQAFVKLGRGLSHSSQSVYSCFLSSSYKCQLLEINFTSNLNTNSELEQEIDDAKYSVHLEGETRE